MSEFEKAISQAAQNSVLKIISDGNWIQTDYASRFKLPPEMLAEVWAMVDIEGLKRKMADRIESELADRIVNHMAAELATDIKQLLSVPERREAIRSVAREHLGHIVTAERDAALGRETALRKDLEKQIARSNDFASKLTGAQQRLTAADERVDLMEKALKFYADGNHLLLADSDAWDTCSGEPVNFLHDDAGTASVEDGSIAKTALKPEEATHDFRMIGTEKMPPMEYDEP